MSDLYDWAAGNVRLQVNTSLVWTPAIWSPGRYTWISIVSGSFRGRTSIYLCLRVVRSQIQLHVMRTLVDFRLRSTQKNHSEMLTGLDCEAHQRYSIYIHMRSEGIYQIENAPKVRNGMAECCNFLRGGVCVERRVVSYQCSNVVEGCFFNELVGYLRPEGGLLCQGGEDEVTYARRRGFGNRYHLQVWQNERTRYNGL